MKYFVNVAGRDLEVVFEQRGDDVYARVGDREHRVSYSEVDGLGQYSILVDGKSWAASIEAPKGSHGKSLEGEFSVGLAGEVFPVLIENERERAAHAAERGGGRGPRTVQAAMPGIVVSLLVKEGDVVEEGAALLVLEAMKMQNEVRAEAAGRVEKIHAEAGKTVSAGQNLVTLGPVPEK
ncbi:MAG: biotin/lipoyl-binding protein [Planctomycetes bacterium]|nr:biotin/lipoyl-binding protein [Planctomycetota bacterium]